MNAKIVVLASGNGSNFEAIVRASQAGQLPAQVVGLVVNRGAAGAIKRAANLGISCKLIEASGFATREAWDQALCDHLRSLKPDWVVLAGFLSLIGPKVLEQFPRRLVNSHPALLPNFGGPGMYGNRVHSAVLAAGEKETGITFHLVDEVYDHGKILRQEKVPVLANDTVETLAARVKEFERAVYPRVLADLVSGRITTG